MSELDERVKSVFDWREYPWWALGAAAFAGFTVARMIKPRPRPGDAWIEVLEDSADRFGRRFEGERSGFAALAVGALAAAAGRAATGYFVQRYQEGYGQRSDHRPSTAQDRPTSFTDIENV